MQGSPYSVTQLATLFSIATFFSPSSLPMVFLFFNEATADLITTGRAPVLYCIQMSLLSIFIFILLLTIIIIIIFFFFYHHFS